MPPHTRRPIERITGIHDAVRRGRFPNCRTLAETFEVTPKTVQRDVTYMRESLELPLAYDEQKHGYYYTEPVSNFPLLDVTNEDLVSLFVAHEALAALEGSPLEASLRTGQRKVAEMMGGQVTLSWSNLERAVSHKRPGTLRKQDIARFEKVTRALLSNCELKFEYRKLGAPGQPWETRRVRPYHLAEVDHGWYIVGWDTNRDDHRTFAIQRMRNVTVLASRRFTVPSDFDPRDHFGGSFGIWSHDAS
ncbi:MAG: WYL domain-containing protein, partial [Planctomycetota bacterium]